MIPQVKEWLSSIRDIVITLGFPIFGVWFYKAIIKLKGEQIKAKNEIIASKEDQIQALKDRLNQLRFLEPEWLTKQYNIIVESLEKKLEHTDSALQVTQQTVKSLYEELRKESTLHSEREKQLLEEKEKLESRVQSLQRDLDFSSKVLKALQIAFPILRRLSQKARYHYEFLKITYLVDTDRNDQTIREFAILCDDEVLFLEEFDFGVTEPTERFEDFSDIHLECILDGEPLYPMKIGEEAGVIKGVAFLFPPLKAGSRAPFKMQAKVVGTWDPLRRQGEDTGIYRLRRSANFFEIRVVLPEKYKKASIHRVQPAVAGRTRIERGDLGRINLIWQIENAEPYTYKYTIKAN